MIKNLLLGLLLGLVLLSSGAFASFTVDVVSTNPAPVVAGDYADITLRFTNLGSTTGTLTQIKNVEFSIKESNFFLPLESEPAKFSVVNSQETITKTFPTQSYVKSIELHFKNCIYQRMIKYFHKINLTKQMTLSKHKIDLSQSYRNSSQRMFTYYSCFKES